MTNFLFAFLFNNFFGVAAEFFLFLKMHELVFVAVFFFFRRSFQFSLPSVAVLRSHRQLRPTRLINGTGPVCQVSSAPSQASPCCQVLILCGNALQ